MVPFLLALQFLTIIPVKIKDTSDSQIAQSMAYFPVIGLLLGLILTQGARFLYFLNFREPFVNIILVVSLVILTGGLHLDGLADTADAFLSRKNKDQMLKILRDSHIGVMGVLSIICILFLKISFLSSLAPSLRNISLLSACILSRWSLVFSMFLFPYAREEGKAKIFIRGMNLKIFILATTAALILITVSWGLQGLFILGIIAACAYLMNKFIKNKIGGITGDTLGASCELNELIVFTICFTSALFNSGYKGIDNTSCEIFSVTFNFFLLAFITFL